MKVSDFDFALPPELIAQYPKAQRNASRLLYLNKTSGAITHKNFIDLPELLAPNDLLVFNDTKVIPARLFGNKATGGKVEILIERILDINLALAHVKASKTPKVGAEILVNNFKATVIERQNDLFKLKFSEEIVAILEQVGHMPLPPYITRADELSDKERYQTVYAKHKGAVAAPTAGLHFDKEILGKIKNKAFITLHVGAGTFQTVRVENVTEHKMHAEYIEVSEAVCEQIKQAKANGGRIIAVGTTCVRSLETAAKTGAIKPFKGETDIFIYPGYKFNCIDGILTNFHLPKSTLLMLVCAFAGFDRVMRAYQAAIQEHYRFFSYGDAMLIL